MNGVPNEGSIYSKVNCESFRLLAGQMKKLSNFEGRDKFFQGMKIFYGPPYVESIYSRVNCESFSLLAGQTKKLSNFEVRDEFFQGGKIILRAILYGVNV